MHNGAPGGMKNYSPFVFLCFCGYFQGRGGDGVLSSRRGGCLFLEDCPRAPVGPRHAANGG